MTVIPVHLAATLSSVLVVIKGVYFYLVFNSSPVTCETHREMTRDVVWKVSFQEPTGQTRFVSDVAKMKCCERPMEKCRLTLC